MLAGLLERARKSLGVVRHAPGAQALAHVRRQVALAGEQGQLLPEIHEGFQAVGAQARRASRVALGGGIALGLRGRAEAGGFQDDRGERARVATQRGQRHAAAHRVAENSGAGALAIGDHAGEGQQRLALRVQRVSACVGRALAFAVSHQVECVYRAAGCGQLSRHGIPRRRALREPVQQDERGGGRAGGCRRATDIERMVGAGREGRGREAGAWCRTTRRRPVRRRLTQQIQEGDSPEREPARLGSEHHRAPTKQAMPTRLA